MMTGCRHYLSTVAFPFELFPNFRRFLFTFQLILLKWLENFDAVTFDTVPKKLFYKLFTCGLLVINVPFFCSLLSKSESSVILIVC